MSCILYSGVIVLCFRKDLSIAQREWKKKKAQKKAQRMKQMEDEREDDKNKWVQFNTKVCKINY